MRVLVTGAYGLIGSACLARLHRDGHELIGAGRAIARRSGAFPMRDGSRPISRGSRARRIGWPLLAGIDAVVNCVGVLQDGARDDIAPRACRRRRCALFDACVQAGIRRVVHISAIGAEPRGPTAFARTKAQADAHLATLDLDWVILRPALVLAPAVYGGTRHAARARRVAAGDAAGRRGEPRPGRERRRRRRDRGVLPRAGCAGEGDVGARASAGAHARRHRRGAAPLARLCAAPVVRLPAVVGSGSSPRPPTRSGWLGWRSPARSTALAQLAAGVVGDPCGLDRRDRHQAARASTTFWPRSRRACRTAGSRGSICSSRSRSPRWRCSGSPPA